MTIYFVSGGLIGSAWVNTVQLVVMMVGFAVALPVVFDRVGRHRPALVQPPAPEWFGDFFYSAGPGSGWTMLFLLAPAFIVSPGLIQKVVRREVGAAVTGRHGAERRRAAGVRVHPDVARHGGPGR